MERVTPLREIALLFLRLGTTAFGGPAAHIALMEDEVVQRRRWMTRGQFLDYLGATNLIPGPNSTELAIHIGRERAGWPGLLVAGACFIAPATIIVTAIAWAYVRYGSLPVTHALLYGVKPVVIAIVAQAVWRLGATAIASWWMGALAVASIAALAAGVHELAVLADAALAGVAGRWRAAAAAGGVAFFAGTTASAAAVPAATAAAPFTLTHLFAVFLKIGSVLFGSGYVLLAFVRADLVQRLGWLTEQQLIDATAVGQVTPGPVFTTATFIGYLLGGIPGAAVATAAIFLPAFVFVAASGPIVPRLRRSRLAGGALDGVNAASLALIAVVTWQLGRSALVDPVTISIATLALLALLLWRVNSTWLIAAGAVLGLLTAQ